MTPEEIQRMREINAAWRKMLNEFNPTPHHTEAFLMDMERYVDPTEAVAALAKIGIRC